MAHRSKRRVGPSDADIEHLVKLVRPRQGQEQCRRYLIDSIALIAKPPPRGWGSASAVRKQLSKLSYRMGRDLEEFRRLHPLAIDRVFWKPWRYHSFVGQLEDVRQSCEREAKEYPNDGGQKRADYSRQLIAARRAFRAKLYWGNREPTLTKGGDYFAIAGLLYKLGTGKNGNLDRTCARHIKELRQYGWPGKDELRRIRRGDVTYLRKLAHEDATNRMAKSRITYALRNSLLRAVFSPRGVK